MQSYIILAISFEAQSYNLILLAILCYYTVIYRSYCPKVECSVAIYLVLYMYVQKAGLNSSLRLVIL